MNKVVSWILAALTALMTFFGYSGEERCPMPEQFTLEGKTIVLSYTPQLCLLDIDIGGETWSWKKAPTLAGEHNIDYPFSLAKCLDYRRESTPEETGVYADYTHFGTAFGPYYDMVVHTFVGVTAGTDDVIFRVWVENEPEKTYKISFPAALDFGAQKDCGYTVLPLSQGALIPARLDAAMAFEGAKIFSREAYMPVFGQVRGETGYAAIFDTPYDARYSVDHKKGGDTTVTPLFETSLGKFAYTRSMIYNFFANGSYNTVAERYRRYLEEKGALKTLNDKIAENPNIAYLAGAPVLHTHIAWDIAEESSYYNHENPAANHVCVPFAQREAELEALKAAGVEKLYIHLDGWGVHGYDNNHPDPFPVKEEAGGAAGMKSLADKAAELGYVFGIHDNYRDFYYKADSFTFDKCLVNADGSHPYETTWYGGKQSLLCARFAPAYVKKNYDTFEQLGIRLGGSYLDVFSIADLDECFSPAHPMTREECVAERRACFGDLTARGIIPSSEEVFDCMLPAISLCHHAPYYCWTWTSDAWKSCVFIPFFNLVYHDCVFTPWFVNGDANGSGSFGMPESDWMFLHAILNGGTTYVYETNSARHLELADIVLQLHRRVALEEMVSHEFVGGDLRHQKTVFGDSTTVEVNFYTNEWSITYPDGTSLSGE